MRLPALVDSHVALQRDRPVPVWGWAAPGEQVTVTFRGKTYPATPAGGPYALTAQVSKHVKLTNILVSDA